MTRPRRTSALVALIIAAGLTLGPAALLGLLEHPISPTLPSMRPTADDTTVGRSDADVVGPVPFPGPAATTDPPRVPGRTPGPGPTGEPTVEPAGPHARLRSAATPLMLHIEDLGVVAPIERVGVLEGGVMEIPADVAVVGWYATEHRRVSPGDPGTAVIAGHRDARSQGLGALHDLASLDMGSLIDIVHADGLVSRWQVELTSTTPRDALPADVLFAREGDPRLALVTCGGTFDSRTRTYSHNTIVLARLAAVDHTTR
jgi:hypothetical protein